jgi:hypothetical protein
MRNYGDACFGKWGKRRLAASPHARIMGPFFSSLAFLQSAFMRSRRSNVRDISCCLFAESMMEKDSQTAKARAVSRHIGIIHLFMASSSTNKYTPWRAVCLGGVG